MPERHESPFPDIPPEFNHDKALRDRIIHTLSYLYEIQGITAVSYDDFVGYVLNLMSGSDEIEDLSATDYIQMHELVYSAHTERYEAEYARGLEPKDTSMLNPLHLASRIWEELVDLYEDGRLRIIYPEVPQNPIEPSIWMIEIKDPAHFEDSEPVWTLPLIEEEGDASSLSDTTKPSQQEITQPMKPLKSFR